MKTIFSLLLFLFTLQVSAQFLGTDNNNLKMLVGSWSGTSVFTEFKKGQMQTTFATALEVADLKDSIQLNFTHTGKDGNNWSETYFMRIYDDKKKLSYDSSQFDIVESRRRGPNYSIYAERSGVDDFRSTDFQHSIIFGAGNLKIVKELRYMDMVSFSIQYRMTLTKNK